MKKSKLAIRLIIPALPLAGVLVLVGSGRPDRGGVNELKPVAVGKGCTNAFAIDEDCDGYGTGPGMLGPDADDSDPDVNTFSSVKRRYGSLEKFLRDKGYEPERVFYIAPDGNDQSAKINDIRKPFASWKAIRALNPTGLRGGDIVVYREGVYTEPVSTRPTNQKDRGARGVPGKPVVIMACPGERVVIDVPGDAIEITGTNKAGPNHLIIRGFVLDNTSAPGRGRGINMYGDYYGPISHVTIESVESLNHFWGMMISQGSRDVSVINSVFRDNSGEHGAYFCSRSLPNAALTVRGCLFYRNRMQGIYHNGRVTEFLIERSIIHSNGTAGIQFVNGVSRSVVRNNLIFNNGKQGIVLYNYCTDLRETCDYILPYDQTDNLFVNNTVWAGRNTVQGNAVIINDACDRYRSCGKEWSRSFDRNVFRNNIFVTYEQETFLFYQPRFIQTTTIENNVVHKFRPGSAAVLRSGPDAGSSLTFAQFEQLSALISNNTFGDPRFRDAGFRAGADPSLFDFQLDRNSPGVDLGSALDAPAEDLRGNPRDSRPDAGCYEWVKPK